MSVYELLEQVKDRDSFLIFLESLAKDYDENQLISKRLLIYFM